MSWLQDSAFWNKMQHKVIEELEHVPDVFITAHQAYVVRNGYQVSPLIIDTHIEDVVLRWEAATGWHGVRDVIRSMSFVFVKPIFYSNVYNHSLGGLALLSTGTAVIGWHPDVEKTALGHEIGHFVLYKWRGDATEEGLKEFAALHRLPY